MAAKRRRRGPGGGGWQTRSSGLGDGLGQHQILPWKKGVT